MSTMSGLVKATFAGGFMLVLTSAPALPADRPFNLGKIATAEEVAGWDIDVRPDGLGAPVGMGNAIDGEEVYADLCAACHGDFGEGVDRWPELVGGEGSLGTHDPLKTTGSYWPYASTLYDYVYRAMPFGESQSLSYDETYQIVAFLLYMNDIIEDDFEVWQGELLKRLVTKNAGIRDHNIHAAKFRHGVINHLLNARIIGDG